MAFGIEFTGFNLKRLEDIQSETRDALRAVLGDDVNLDDRGPLGQIKGVLDGEFSDLWEKLQDVYSSQYPNTSSNISLDNVLALIGLIRKQPTKSTVAGYNLLGTATSLIPAGTIFSVIGDTSKRFVTDADVTLVAGTDEEQTITFGNAPDAGAITFKYNDEETSSIAFGDIDAANFQTALRALPSLDALVVTGPVGSDFTVIFSGLDGKFDHPLLTVGTNTLQDTPTPTTVVISETVPGVPQGQVGLSAETAGATSAAVNTITEIETPVSGLSNGKNYAVAVEGQDLETDPEAKLRREQSVQKAGNSTIEAIRASLLEVSGVTDVIIIENDTNSTDGDGRPPKSYEVIILGGDEDEIALEIWNTKPAGIETVSTAAGGNEKNIVITDTMGFNHTMNFSLPTEIPIFCDLTLTVDSDYPTDGDAQVELAVIAFGNALGVGKDVIVFPQLITAIGTIPGITDIVVDIDTSGSPSGDANITIAATEISTWDAANINVTS